MNEKAVGVRRVCLNSVLSLKHRSHSVTLSMASYGGAEASVSVCDVSKETVATAASAVIHCVCSLVGPGPWGCTSRFVSSMGGSLSPVTCPVPGLSHSCRGGPALCFQGSKPCSVFHMLARLSEWLDLGVFVPIALHLRPSLLFFLPDSLQVALRGCMDLGICPHSVIAAAGAGGEPGLL